jgi:hypothetical protein
LLFLRGDWAIVSAGGRDVNSRENLVTAEAEAGLTLA